MTRPTPPATPLRLDASRVSNSWVEALLAGCALAEPETLVVDVTGPGAVECLQGLVSCDLEARGSSGFLYGAVLTRFGMIVADLWAARHESGVRLVVPARGVAPLLEVLTKSLPPRLARPTEPADVGVLRLVGPRAVSTLEAAGLELPEPGTATSVALPEGRIDIAHAMPGAPFVVQLAAPSLAPLRQRLVTQGVVEAGGDLLEMGRVLAGWPALEREIDAKTLPQEVRYDDFAGVSYTKGCFVGQETVARVHFRGRPNRALRGLLFDREPATEADVRVGDREMGRVTAQAWLGPRRRWIGLAMLRREVDVGTAVQASRVSATVVPLPFALEIV